MHMADFFRYASAHLIDKPVIALNSDIGECDCEQSFTETW